MSTTTSRRSFLAGSAAVVAGALWTPVFRLPAAHASGHDGPPDFPHDIELYRMAYENWAGEIRADDLWTSAPRTPDDVVTLANWARDHGYRLRPRGAMHSWAPLTVSDGEGSDARVILVDTTQHLTAMTIVSAPTSAVRVQTGALMETVLTVLESHGLGMATAVSTGGVTVGGVLAVGAHGASIPRAGERRPPGHSHGSLSNLVLSLTAVVWDQGRRRYVLRTFDRSDTDSAAFLTHLGRAFLTEVTLQVGPNQHIRCVSTTDVPATELFARPGTAGARTFTRYLDAAGRVEAIWFAFTDAPWLKVWSVAPVKPPTSRQVSEPYNYPFADNMPAELQSLCKTMMDGEGETTPLFTQGAQRAVSAGLVATQSADIWGPSKNVLLYAKASTFRVHTQGYAVLLRRADLQRALWEFADFYQRTLDDYRARDQYPINFGMEVRVSGLDQPEEVERDGAAVPALSSTAPRSDRPELDVVLWLNTLSFPGSPHFNAFAVELERWLVTNYSSYGVVRPEWSKSCAHGAAGQWTDPEQLVTIPDAYRSRTGQGHGGWDWAVTTLDRYDPARVFASPLLDRLMPSDG